MYARCWLGSTRPGHMGAWRAVPRCCVGTVAEGRQRGWVPCLTRRGRGIGSVLGNPVPSSSPERATFHVKPRLHTPPGRRVPTSPRRPPGWSGQTGPDSWPRSARRNAGEPGRPPGRAEPFGGIRRSSRDAREIGKAVFHVKRCARSRSRGHLAATGHLLWFHVKRCARRTRPGDHRSARGRGAPARGQSRRGSYCGTGNDVSAEGRRGALVVRRAPPAVRPR